mmetsp:Transcript_43172/g.97273  ORF Transcript_43172/g.97273 Transcript_43172/m.97273 type:complete len:318 (+) Transcript_43172:42-995(+)
MQPPSAQSVHSFASSSVLWGRRDQCLVIYDFDDTIFPTSWMCTNVPEQMTLAGPTGESLEHISRPLEILAEKVHTMLQATLGVAEVVFITNSKQGWVESCIRHFVPELTEPFQSIKVIYARNVFEKSGKATSVGAPVLDAESDDFDLSLLTMAWKVEAMKTALLEFYGERSWKNIISIGDSFDELRALQEVTFLHENPQSAKTGSQKPMRAKAIKMLQNPTVHELVAQVSALTHFIPAIVGLDGDIEIQVELNQAMVMQYCMNEMSAHSWFSKGEAWSEQFEATLDDPQALLSEGSLYKLSRGMVADGSGGLPNVQE